LRQKEKRIWLPEMSRYFLEHTTHYHYEHDVSGSHHAAILEPTTLPWQRVEAFTLNISPSPRDLRARVDSFGNQLHLWSLETPHQELKVQANAEVTVTRVAPNLSLLSMSCADAQQWTSSENASLAIRQYAFASPRIRSSEGVRAFAERFFAPEVPLLVAAQQLNAAIFEEFTFDAEATHADTSTAQFLKLKRGVCQDFTHLMLATLREAGFAARYVSGYILTHPTDGEPRLIGADASHAWVSLYEPTFGWVDFDPTNNLLVADEHITVAWGRDFGDVSMVRGAVRGGGAHKLEVAVTMLPAEEADAVLAQENRSTG